MTSEADKSNEAIEQPTEEIEPQAIEPEPDNKRVVVALDAMGGDNAPGSIIEGAALGAKTLQNLDIVLVGNQSVIEEELRKRGYAEYNNISIRHAEEVIDMDDSPSVALRQKKKSSIHVGCRMVKEKEADAFVSAGNTGAVMAVASVYLRTMEGIDRAGIAVTLPNPAGHVVLLDAGANVSVKANNLFQFGVMGSIYAHYILDDEKPRVGLLSIGEEEGKGNNITKEAYELLNRSSLNFVGNTEAKQLYKDAAEVVVCDGFTGNIALKVSESLAGMITGFLKDIFKGSWRGKLAYLLLRKDLDTMKKRIDHAEVGGAPLLGIDGAIFISHGSSDDRSIRSALAAAKKFIENDVNAHIRETLAANSGILVASEQAPDGVWHKVKGLFNKGAQPSDENQPDNEKP